MRMTLGGRGGSAGCEFGAIEVDRSASATGRPADHRTCVRRTAQLRQDCHRSLVGTLHLKARSTCPSSAFGLGPRRALGLSEALGHDASHANIQRLHPPPARSFIGENVRGARTPPVGDWRPINLQRSSRRVGVARTSTPGFLGKARNDGGEAGAHAGAKSYDAVVCIVDNGSRRGNHFG